MSDIIKLSGDGIFISIQGEGDSIGAPSIFVRLANCNLNCSWCDTKYSWDKNDPEYTVTEVTIDELKTTLQEMIYETKIKNIVVTGGEPLLQRKNLDILVEKFNGVTFEIETNGTIEPTHSIKMNCKINCSPKLKNSGCATFNPDVVRSINRHYSIFKFVIESESDLDEIKELYLPLINKQRIYLMPQTNSNVDRKMVVKMCIENNFTYSPRVHFDIWGNQRRV